MTMTSQDRAAKLKAARAFMAIAQKPIPEPVQPETPHADEPATDFMDHLSKMFPGFQPQPPPKNPAE